MDGHFVVCGMGEVGYRVATLLRRLGEPVSVVTRECRDDWLKAAEEDGVLVLRGDARDLRLLEDAGIREARALIVATDQDAVNVEVALDARREREDLPVVARLFDQTLAQRLEETFGLRRALSMSAVAAPQFAAAARGANTVGSFVMNDRVWLVGRLTIDANAPLADLTVRDVGQRYGLAVLARDASGTWQFMPGLDATLWDGDRVTLVGQASDWAVLDPASGSSRIRSGLQNLSRDIARALNPFVLLHGLRAVWRNAPASLRGAFVLLNLLIALSVWIFHAAMDLTLVDALHFVVGTVTTAGGANVTLISDALKLYAAALMILGSLAVAILYSIITDFIVTARFQQRLGAREVEQGGHLVVVGLGNVGYRVVEQLRRSGQRVVAVDHDAQADFVQAARAHIPVVLGDARVPDTLLKAGIDRAQAVVVVTHDDPTNLAVGLTARQLAPAIRTVVRLFDADFARNAQDSLGIDVAMSASMVAGPVFVGASLYPHVRHALVLDSHLIVLTEHTVGPDLEGLTPSQFGAEQQCRALFRRASGRAYAVAGDAALAPGEEILAAVCRPLIR